MAKIRYYTDENVSRATINGLRQRGVDVLSCQQADLMGVTDEEQLEHATQNGRVIFTKDNDFLKLHAGGKEHTRIVYALPNNSIGDIVKGLMLIFEVLDAEDMINHIEFV